MSAGPDTLEEDEREFGAVLYLRAAQSGAQADVAALHQWIGSNAARQGLVDGLAQVWYGVGELNETPQVAFSQAQAAQPVIQHQRPRGRTWLAIAASIVLTVAFATALMVKNASQTGAGQQFATSIGERKELILDDGSKVVLDAASRLAVDYRSDERIVRLESGQAFFDVAHDADRPFHVEFSGHDVEALGTEFNVSVGILDSSISLVDGSVRVSSLEQGNSLFGLRQEMRRQPIVTLEPGQQFALDDGKAASIQRFDRHAVGAWQQGRVVFDDLPLAEAVAVMNRYSQRTIVLDAGLPTKNLSGVFDAGDGMAFAETAATYLPGARIEATQDRIFIGKGD